jgi:hypothetical protein
MPETPTEKESEKGKKPQGLLALLTGVGSVLLYFFGYLSLRFHLSVLGVDTDLAVLDERYLFAGAQFLVYLVTSVPVALFFLFIARWVWRCFHPRFLGSPERMIISGIALSIILIQSVERRCLPFTNLLLGGRLPAPGWVQELLLDERGALQSLYFSALLACILGLAWLLIAASGTKIRSWSVPSWALAGLVVIQFLLLPVTFGILIENRTVPRVTTMEGKEPLNSDVQAWRVWEGKDSVTFFVRRWDATHETQRTLLTLNKEDIKKTEITGNDPLLRLIYGWPGDSPAASGTGQERK